MNSGPNDPHESLSSGLASSEITSKLEDSFARVTQRLDELAMLLPLAQCDLLSHLLSASRQHPLIGDGVDSSIVAIANQHISPHVKPSRRRACEIADRMAARVATRAKTTNALVEHREDSGRALSHLLRRELENLPMLEREHLRELLSNALGGLAPSGVPPSAGWQRAAWLAGVCTLSSPSTKLPAAGRPEFLDPELLKALTIEARIQSFLSVRMALRYVAPPAKAARRFGASAELRRYVSCCVGHNVSAGNGFSEENATYLYYENAGDGIQPHVDPFGISNALIMLERTPVAGGSHLLIYDHNGHRIPVPFEPGDVVVLADGAIVHAREPLKHAEKITLLSLVFARPGSRAS